MSNMMEQPMSRFPERSSLKQENVMPAVVEARSMICAVPRDPRHTRATWLQYVGNLLGIHPRQAKKIFYGELKRIDADTFRRMQSNLEALQTKALERRETLNELKARRDELGSGQGSGNPPRHSE